VSQHPVDRFDFNVDNIDLVPRQRFCREAKISERTFDRRADIPKIRKGRRVFAPRAHLEAIVNRSQLPRGAK